MAALLVVVLSDFTVTSVTFVIYAMCAALAGLGASIAGYLTR